MAGRHTCVHEVDNGYVVLCYPDQAHLSFVRPLEYIAKTLMEAQHIQDEFLLRDCDTQVGRGGRY